MLQRNQVEAQYQTGPNALTYHTLVRQDLPLDVKAFMERFPDMPIGIVP